MGIDKNTLRHCRATTGSPAHNITLPASHFPDANMLCHGRKGPGLRNIGTVHMTTLLCAWLTPAPNRYFLRRAPTAKVLRGLNQLRRLRT